MYHETVAKLMVLLLSGDSQSQQAAALTVPVHTSDAQVVQTQTKSNKRTMIESLKRNFTGNNYFTKSENGHYLLIQTIPG